MCVLATPTLHRTETKQPEADQAEGRGLGDAFRGIGRKRESRVLQFRAMLESPGLEKTSIRPTVARWWHVWGLVLCRLLLVGQTWICSGAPSILQDITLPRIRRSGLCIGWRTQAKGRQIMTATLDIVPSYIRSHGDTKDYERIQHSVHDALVQWDTSCNDQCVVEKRAVARVQS